MEKELGADVIKATQASLGRYVKRPPLSEKLLRKPPFRFLHDIVSAVHRTTGFFEGLFEEDELISENVKDRESKILFLNKVISVIGTTTGKSLEVKSSKIVAGQEPHKTNELLQCLALALDKKLSSDEAVKKYKDSAKPVSSEIKQKEKDTSKTAKKSNDTKKLKSKGNEKPTINKKDIGTVNTSDITGSESKHKRLDKNEVNTKSHQLKNNKNTAVTDKSVTNKTKPLVDLKENQDATKKKGPKKEDDNKKDVDQSNVLPSTEITKIIDDQSNHLTSKGCIPSTDYEFQMKLNSSDTIGENELNSSLSSQDLMEFQVSERSEIFVENKINDDVKDHDDAIHSQNTIFVKETTFLPNTSVETLTKENRAGVTDNKKNELIKSDTNADKVDSNSSSRKKTDIVRPPSVRPSSSRPGAPRLREKIDNVIPDTDNLLLAKVNIITENTNMEDEEEPNVVLEEHSNEQTMLNTQPNQLQLSSIEHGHLVQQILDSQKEFSQIGKTEIEWQFGAQKVKEAVNQEIEQLRFNIQALSRVANPLGKLLDHIQEDAEVMRQELQQWTNVYDEVSKEMQKQKSANYETLVPLQTRLKLLEIDVQEKRDKIDDLKILIHKNSSRIEKLLTNGNVQ